MLRPARTVTGMTLTPEAARSRIMLQLRPQDVEPLIPDAIVDKLVDLAVATDLGTAMYVGWDYRVTELTTVYNVKADGAEVSRIQQYQSAVAQRDTWAPGGVNDPSAQQPGTGTGTGRGIRSVRTVRR